MQNDEKEIRKLVETWLSASQAGDIETVLSLMTDDIVFLVVGQPPMIGKASFAAASKAQSEQPFRISGTSDIQEIRVFGEWAYMWTKLSVVATPMKDGQSVNQACRPYAIYPEKAGWQMAVSSRCKHVNGRSQRR